MCQMKENAMSRTGELPADQIPAVGYSGAAVLALTQQMVDLAREIEGAGTILMVSQAADILNAIRTLPVVDGAVQAELTKVMRGEITTLTAECERLAAKLNAPGVPQVLAAPKLPGFTMETIFESWDGCMYEDIDIGAALGVDFAKIATQPQPTAPAAAVSNLAQASVAGFKNFHRSLCARFGYTHDEQFWWRDLISLEEHIAATQPQPTVPSERGGADAASAAGQSSDMAIIREALEATFEQRPGFLIKVSAAIRALAQPGGEKA